MQFHHRVSQRIGDAEVGQGRSNPPQKYLLGSGAGNDEPTDTNIGIGQNAHARREVKGLRWATARRWGHTRRTTEIGRASCRERVWVSGVAGGRRQRSQTE